MLGRFSDKVAIVTGAGSGIGRATFLRLIKEGCTVIGVDINTIELLETITMDKEGPGKVGTYYPADISDEESVKKIVNEVILNYGKLDILINMAGILRTSHSINTSLSDFLKVINVNLVGTFIFCREALPHLIKTKGNIVNCASTAAFYGHPYMAAYAASKGGIMSMTKSLALEYMKSGVRINAIAPGGIDTPLAQNAFSNMKDEVDWSLIEHLSRPDKKMGSPEEVASVIAMLASEDGAFMNGEVIKIDGGVHC